MLLHETNGYFQRHYRVHIICQTVKKEALTWAVSLCKDNSLVCEREKYLFCTFVKSAIVRKFRIVFKIFIKITTRFLAFKILVSFNEL